MSQVSFRPFKKEDLPLYYEWAKIDHVKNTWFIDGYEPVESIEEKIRGNGYDFPYIITLDEKPIGYLLACDLDAYHVMNPNTDAPTYQERPEGAFSIDLFIADKENLGKGYGTEVLKKFCTWLLKKPEVNVLLIDPSIENKPAIRCYEKVGFKFVREEFDGITTCHVMELHS